MTLDEKLVDIKVSVTQVTDGIEYNGTVSFDEDMFNYNIKFGRSIPVSVLASGRIRGCRIKPGSHGNFLLSCSGIKCGLYESCRNAVCCG